MGGGRQDFRGTNVVDEDLWPGNRTDGRDLINEWLELHKLDRAAYIWNAVCIQLGNRRRHTKIFKTFICFRLTYVK